MPHPLAQSEGSGFQTTFLSSHCVALASVPTFLDLYPSFCCMYSVFAAVKFGI